MKNGFCVALAFVALVGFSAGKVHARGGGHGGGHHGGGHHGGGHHNGHHSGHHSGHHNHDHHHGHHDYHHHSHVHAHYHPGNRPFTHGWYGNHAGAWGNGWSYPTGYNGWWTGAGFGAAATWLGMNAVSPSAYAYPAGVSTVYTADTTNGSGQAGQTAANAASDTPGTSTANYDAQLAAATKLAQSGATDPPKTEQFLPLGVFSLAPEDQEEASAMVQIAVSKSGIVRGTYYDLVGDKEQPIVGAVDKETQKVAFTAGGKTVFETGLANLTQNESGPVSLFFENGAGRPWTLSRWEDDEAADTDASKVE